MEHHEGAVARLLEILLDVVGAEAQGEVVGREGVLGRVAGGAAVADVQHEVLAG